MAEQKQIQKKILSALSMMVVKLPTRQAMHDDI